MRTNCSHHLYQHWSHHSILLMWRNVMVYILLVIDIFFIWIYPFSLYKWFIWLFNCRFCCRSSLSSDISLVDEGGAKDCRLLFGSFEVPWEVCSRSNSTWYRSEFIDICVAKGLCFGIVCGFELFFHLDAGRFFYVIYYQLIVNRPSLLV